MKPSHLSTVLSAISLSLSLAQAQQNSSSVSYSDPSAGVSFTLSIPSASSAPFPLLLTISAPQTVGWAGFATGGCMLRSPLILAWPNGPSVVATTRWAVAFHPPVPYLNTTLTLLPSSTSNSTHWTAHILCTAGCSSWPGGSIDPNYNNATFGYGLSSHSVASPDVSSAIRFHDLGFGHFDWDMNLAKNSQDGFDALVKGYGG